MNYVINRIDETCFIRKCYKKYEENCHLRFLHNARQQAIQTGNKKYSQIEAGNNAGKGKFKNCAKEHLLFFFVPDDKDDDLRDESDDERVKSGMESVELSAVMSTSSTSTWDEFAPKKC